MPEGRFAIWRTDQGPVCVTAPARRRILEVLDGGEKPFGAVVAAVGKAKSTVSIHLQRMADQGIVRVRKDPDDARRRHYSLAGDPLLEARPGVTSEDEVDVDHLDPAGLLVALTGTLARAGLDARSLFRVVGETLGRRIGPCSDRASAAERIARRWRKWGLGEATVGADEVRLRPAAWTRHPGIHASALLRGLLEGALDEDVPPLEETGDGVLLHPGQGSTKG